MKQKWYCALLFCFATAIFWSSTTVVTQKQLATGVHSITGASSESFLHQWKAVWWIFVKGWHATEFGIVYWLCRKTEISVKMSILAACGYAVFDEIHQIVVPNRGARVSDMLIDLIGILIGFYILDVRSRAKWSRGREVAIGFCLLCLLAVLSFHPFGSLESVFNR
jgi:hypothetical protein